MRAVEPGAVTPRLTLTALAVGLLGLSLLDAAPWVGWPMAVIGLAVAGAGLRAWVWRG